MYIEKTLKYNGSYNQVLNRLISKIELLIKGTLKLP